MYKIDSIDYTNKTTFVFNIATLKKGISNKKTIFWSRGLVKKMGETLGLVRLTLARKLQPLLYIIRY